MTRANNVLNSVLQDKRLLCCRLCHTLLICHPCHLYMDSSSGPQPDCFSLLVVGTLLPLSKRPESEHSSSNDTRKENQLQTMPANPVPAGQADCKLDTLNNTCEHDLVSSQSSTMEVLSKVVISACKLNNWGSNLYC